MQGVPDYGKTTFISLDALLRIICVIEIHKYVNINVTPIDGSINCIIGITVFISLTLSQNKNTPLSYIIIDARSS